MLMHEYLGQRQKNAQVGVEIEMEGYDLPDHVVYWRVDDDGSLKSEENAEYVMDPPINIARLDEVFDSLEKALDDCGSEVNDTYRAGVHVHVNVQDLTPVQFVNLVCIFFILEELFIDYCAPSRKGNHFCLRARDAEYMITLLRDAFETGNLKMLNTDDIRYSAMNVRSVFKHGTVEFRSHESTRDFEKIKTWVRMLYKLHGAAQLYNNPKEIMADVSMGGYAGFVTKIMGEYAPWMLSQPNAQKKIREGILHAQDLAFARDWRKVNLNIFSKQQNIF